MAKVVLRWQNRNSNSKLPPQKSSEAEPWSAEDHLWTHNTQTLEADGQQQDWQVQTEWSEGGVKPLPLSDSTGCWCCDIEHFGFLRVSWASLPLRQTEEFQQPVSVPIASTGVDHMPSQSGDDTDTWHWLCLHASHSQLTHWSPTTTELQQSCGQNLRGVLPAPC